MSFIADIDRRLDPWTEALGDDRDGYRNHVIRMLTACDLLADVVGVGDPQPSTREEFVTAAVFHDLGIWSDGTWDYLAPSVQRASDWLDSAGRSELKPHVADMISLHHKVRSAGPKNSDVEIFRRADLVDVSFGKVSFGISREAWQKVSTEYPDAGFHKRLISLTVQRMKTKPLSPMPMMKW